MEKKIIIKNSWKEVTINEYLELISLLKLNKSDIIDIEAHIICVLTNLTYDEVMQLDLTTFKSILKHFKFLETKPQGELKEKYTIGDKVYVVNYNYNNMTVTQYLNLNYVNQQKENILDNIGIALASFMTPEGCDANKIDIQKEGKYISEHMNIADANAFFLLYKVCFEKLTQTYHSFLMKKMKKCLKMKEIHQDKEKMKKLEETIMTLEKLGLGNI